MPTGFSSQNSGNRPRTVAVGGRNFQPDAGNPDLWPVFNDQGQQRINARIRPENTRLMGGGIDAFKLVNSPYGRQNGIGFKRAENEVQEMRRGLPDPNRPLFDLNPYGGGGNQAPQAEQEGPNEEQQGWAQANMQPAIIPAAQAQTATPMANSMMQNAMRMPSRGDLVRQNPLLASKRGEMNKGTPTAPSQPLNFSRTSLVQGAKAKGDFDRVRSDYNEKATGAGTGMQMDDMGNIKPLSKLADAQGTSPFARAKWGAGAEDVRARRDFASGRTVDTSGTSGMVKQDNGARPTQAMDFKRSISSAYGTGSNQSTMPRSGGGVMPDPLTGQLIPMNPYLKQQQAVQNTKFGPNSQQAGEDYLNPNKIASQFSNTKPLDAAKGAYFRNKVRGTA